jgi:glycosyltransferase involved in cell wall biosynthesis
MINVLVCEAGIGYGGSAAHLYTFLRHLDKDTYHPVVLFYKKGTGPFIRKIEELGVEVEFLSNEQDYKYNKYSRFRFIKYIQIILSFLKDNFVPTLRVIAIIKKRKIDLVLSNQEVMHQIPTIFAAAIIRIPCVVRKGGVGLYDGYKMMKALSFLPDAFIPISHAEYNFHIESGFPYKKMAVIFAGVDVDEFKPGQKVTKIHDEFGIAPGTPIIGLISRIDKGKGHEDVIAAAAMVLKEFPYAMFLIVGAENDSLLKNLIDQSNSLGLQDKVIFAGWRTDTADIMREIDIFVHCPNIWREGMGIATLEALASGKPVVITDNWGLSETTKDGLNGFVVPIGDREKIAESILTLLKDKDLREKMGANSRARAHELFDIRKNVKLIENIMSEILST